MKSNKMEILKYFLYRDFIYTEAIKRHVEEYEYQDYALIYDWRERYRSRLGETTDNNFYAIFWLAIDAYKSFKDGHIYHYSEYSQKIADENKNAFDFVRMSAWYDKILEIGLKYDINPIEIIYPIDMESLMKEYINNDYIPISDRLKKYSSSNISIFSNGDKFLISQNQFDEDDIDFIKYNFILKKIINNEYIEKYEIEMVNSILKKINPIALRNESYSRAIIGFYNWDAMKFKYDTEKVYNLLKSFQQSKPNSKCAKCISNINSISAENDNIESCQRYIRDARRIISNSIFDKKIYTSSKDLKTIRPQNFSKTNRYPVTFFNITDGS